MWRDHALSQAQFSEKSQELAIAREILAGMPDKAIPTLIDVTGIPTKPGLIESEATWEFELALALLESGDPVGAGQRFVRCLNFNPKIIVRPLIEDYLKKLNVPIPLDPTAEPKKDEKVEAPAKAEAAAVEPAKPEAAPVEPAKSEAQPKPEPPK